MKLSDLKEQETMLEMATLPPRETGVNFTIWIGMVGGKHGPRIKVSNTPGRFNETDNFSLDVSLTPEVVTPPTSVGIKQGELNKVIKWIQINYDDLMLLWKIYETGDSIQLPNGEFLGVGGILSRLKKI